MNNTLRTIGLFVVLFLSVNLQAQNILSKSEAIKIAMEENFDVKIADQNLEVAENNTSIFNSGYLPTLTGNAGFSFNRDALNVEFQDGSERTLDGAKSNSRNAGLALNWIVFNGFNRKYNVARNQENLNLGQLNAKFALENVMLNLFNSYYTVARNQQTLESLEETLDISKERLIRAEYGFDYGRNSRLDVSNAEVDINTDSINYLNAKQTLGDAIRNLNLILAQETSETYEVDTMLFFTDLNDKEEFIKSLKIENVQVQQAKAGISISQYDTRINNSRFMPTVSFNGGYNARLGNNNSASFTAANSSSGLTYGGTLAWNIFEGGAAKIAVENSKVNEGIQQTLLEQTTQQIITNFENAWADYQNKLYIVQAQERNLSTNKLNFERTTEQYKIGSVSSLDFRTAQNNLLTARNSLIQAKYDAKIAELLIFQLSGKIQEVEF